MTKNAFIQKNFTFIFCLLFALGLFLSFWYAHHQVLKGDQFQMLQKGYTGAYSGYWISYGSSASAAGNIPGTLSSLLVGMPLLIVDSPWAPMTFLILIHAISFLLFDSVIRNTFKDNRIRLVFLALYWLNPWFLFENKLYNISYLFLCSALHMWSAFNMRQKKSFMYTSLHLLAIGMAMQLHHSWVILPIISLYMLYKGLIRINWLGVFFACMVIVGSLIPYLNEFFHNEAVRHNVGEKSAERYIGWGGLHIYPVLKAFSYWFRYGSFYFTKHLVSEADFNWLLSNESYQRYASYIYQAIVYIIGIFTVWISWMSNRFIYLKIKSMILKKIRTGPSDMEWVAMYVAGTFIAVFLSAVLSPIVFVHWHLMMIFPVALFPFLFLADSDYPRYLGRFFIPIIMFILVVNLVTSIDSTRFDLNHNYAQQAREFVNTDKVLKDSNKIEEFKQKIIFDPW